MQVMSGTARYAAVFEYLASDSYQQQVERVQEVLKMELALYGLNGSVHDKLTQVTSLGR